MTSDSFARRYGYQEDEIVFEKPDCLPDHIRKRAGLMIVGIFVKQYQGQEEFVEIVKRVLPRSQELWEWLHTIPAPCPNYGGLHTTYDYSRVIRHLVLPLQDCDWRLFYTVVERVCEQPRIAGTQVEESFATDFNYLLSSHRIPWELQGRLVIPVADSEFAEDLKNAREVTHPPTADHVNDPHELIRDALAALYRKQGGPDLSAACVHAWGAWKAAASAASGFGARDGRTFEFVGDEYPALGSTMKAWQKLAEEGRHPETGAPLTESETRFIVMLCVNAVRFLCTTCRSDDAA